MCRLRDSTGVHTTEAVLLHCAVSTRDVPFDVVVHCQYGYDCGGYIAQVPQGQDEGGHMHAGVRPADVGVTDANVEALLCGLAHLRQV